MTLWLVKWKMTQQYWSLSGPERVKVLQGFMKLREADVKSGFQKAVYYTPRGLYGYTICEGTEAQVFEGLVKFDPYICQESVEDLITPEQLTEIAERRMAAMKKQV